MNFIAHLLVSYAIGAKLADWPLAILVAVIFGTLPDIDHLPHLKKALSTGRFGPQVRSALHELAGLSLMSVAAILLSAWIPFGVMFYPLLSHYLLDFLTRPTRPFHPFSPEVIHLGVYPKSYLGVVMADLIVTGGIVLWMIS